jgi:hypothetical protein
MRCAGRGGRGQGAEDAAAAAQALADKRNDLLIQLMEARATPPARSPPSADELAGLDESLRALQLQIYAAQDAAEAQKALADAQAAAAQAADEAARAAQELADKRTDLEIRLMRATGDEIGATALERERELAALDPTLRDLQMQVYAAEDLKAAQDAQSNSLNDLIGKYRDAGNSLRDYRASLAGAAALSPERPIAPRRGNSRRWRPRRAPATWIRSARSRERRRISSTPARPALPRCSTIAAMWRASPMRWTRRSRPPMPG